MANYAIIIVPLSDADGGGFAAYVPDLPGCMSDGATPEEAALNVQDAIEGWLELHSTRGFDRPEPGRAAREIQTVRKAWQDELKAMAAQVAKESPEFERVLNRVIKQSQAYENRLVEAMHWYHLEDQGALAAPAKTPKVA